MANKAIAIEEPVSRKMPEAAAKKVVAKEPHREKMAEIPTNTVKDVTASAMM